MATQSRHCYMFILLLGDQCFNLGWPHHGLWKNTPEPSYSAMNDTRVASVYQSLCSLFLHCKLRPITWKANWQACNSNFYTSKYFLNSPNKNIFRHLEPICFTYPMKPHPIAAGHWWDRALGLQDPKLPQSFRVLWPRDSPSGSWTTSPRQIRPLSDPLLSQQFPFPPPFLDGRSCAHCSLWTFSFCEGPCLSCNPVQVPHNKACYVLLPLVVIFFP